jgi:DNA-binding HxlR family transcriptional regulator
MKLQKETQRHGKWYDDACGTAFALELVGERWSLLIVRELMFGPRRFTDLRGGLPGISAKVLTERLDGLEGAGIVARRRLPPPGAVQVYELTEWGLRADEAIMALGRWAALSQGHDPTLPLSAASLMMSFRTMFDAGRAGRLALTVHLRVGEESFGAAVADGKLGITRGVPANADAAIFAPDPMTIAALVYGKVPAADLAGAGLVVDGDPKRTAAFTDLFELPPKCG